MLTVTSRTGRAAYLMAAGIEAYECPDAKLAGDFHFANPLVGMQCLCGIDWIMGEGR